MRGGDEGTFGNFEISDGEVAELDGEPLGTLEYLDEEELDGVEVCEVELTAGLKRANLSGEIFFTGFWDTGLPGVCEFELIENGGGGGTGGRLGATSGTLTGMGCGGFAGAGGRASTDTEEGGGFAGTGG